MMRLCRHTRAIVYNSLAIPLHQQLATPRQCDIIKIKFSIIEVNFTAMITDTKAWTFDGRHEATACILQGALQHQVSLKVCDNVHAFDPLQCVAFVLNHPLVNSRTGLWMDATRVYACLFCYNYLRTVSLPCQVQSFSCLFISSDSAVYRCLSTLLPYIAIL